MNSSKFYEAHETLEDVWRAGRQERSASNLMLKGLINGAVAMHHSSKGNASGATKCTQTYLKYRAYLDEVDEETRILFLEAFKVTDRLLSLL
jgi:predicted metal-dependent hydrolase